MGSVARHGPFPAGKHPSEAPQPSTQTSPEDVFLLWLLQLPERADVAEAARSEIARLDRAAPLSPGPARLRELLAEAAEAGSPRISRLRR